MHAQEDARSGSVDTVVRRVTADNRSFFQVDASAFSRSPPTRAWRVLTDYERLPDFVPALRSSQRISRSEDAIILKQESDFGYLFLSQRIHLLLRVTEHPYSAIDVALVSGDMKHYVARWELAPETRDGVNGTRITFSGQIEPDLSIPSPLGRLLIKRDMDRTLEAVVTEIDRE
jgi:ribosome-associated toxin RatA of RatAB toxin-antitoxin module